MGRRGVRGGPRRRDQRQSRCALRRDILCFGSASGDGLPNRFANGKALFQGLDSDPVDHEGFAAMQMKRISVAVLVGCAAMLLPRIAFAHAHLLSSTPAASATVHGPDVAIELRFNSRVDGRSLRSYAGDGRWAHSGRFPGQPERRKQSEGARCAEAGQLHAALAGALHRRSHHARRNPVHGTLEPT